MTNEEAIKFIEEVIKGLWKLWDPTAEQLSFYKKELMASEYESARLAVRNFWVQLNDRYLRNEPPHQRLLNVIRKSLSKEKRKSDNSPVLLFSLCRQYVDDNGITKLSPFNKVFLSKKNKMPTSPEIIEQEAERTRMRAQEMYGYKLVIMRDWEKLFRQ